MQALVAGMLIILSFPNKMSICHIIPFKLDLGLHKFLFQNLLPRFLFPEKLTKHEKTSFSLCPFKNKLNLIFQEYANFRSYFLILPFCMPCLVSQECGGRVSKECGGRVSKTAHLNFF